MYITEGINPIGYVYPGFGIVLDTMRAYRNLFGVPLLSRMKYSGGGSEFIYAPIREPNAN